MIAHTIKRIVCLGCLSLAAADMSARDRALEKSIRTFLRDRQATVAVAVLSDGRMIASIEGKTELPTMSVCKFYQALAVLDPAGGSSLSPDSLLSFGESQLPRDTHSPLRDSIPQGGTLAVRDLIRYALIVSDNNACDILLAAAGGPETVDRYVRRQGIRGVTIAATEQTMHERFENQYLNRTTAEAAVRILERLDTGGLLPAERRKLVEEAMIASRTGSRRIRSVLPGDVVAGDKTGSSLRSAEGMTAADNDLAFVRLPDGTTYYMAVLVANSFEDDRTNEATIAGISRIVYDYFVERE